ncbi:hypothetical protein EB118_09550 [bacterium]|nr:hypothetical protein [bacterium]
MELFYPSLLVFLLSLIVVFYLLPRLTPIVMTILAGILLILGVSHHYFLFKSDYVNSTWQDSLKLYAPAIAIGVLIIFIISYIFNVFTYGSVPIPSLPAVPNVGSTANTLVAPVSAAVTNVSETIGNTVTNIGEKIGETVRNVRNTITGNINNRTILGGGKRK